LEALKRRVSKTSAAFVSLVFGALSGLGLNAYFSQTEQQTVTGQMTYTLPVTPLPPPSRENDYLLPEATVPEMPSYEPTPNKGKRRGAATVEYSTALGGIANTDEVRQQVKEKRRR
jgi:hypothetical protein